MTYAYIIAGAMAGAPLRYFVQGRVQDATGITFPWGTLVVNVTGCLLIGILLTLAEERDVLSREARLLLVVGFLGSYTTFSTFGWETVALLRDNDIARAGGNVVLSTIGGLVGVWLGIILARTVWR
ncbi:MAG TPA: fluoride efflux transporter CrcB [Tepidiformaceae bacterium]|nr:fluoride efflux transporter CrcB [Tepidiformaceae bacterium]